MINRTLIRIKILQLLYAFYQNGEGRPESAEKILMESLDKAYDLYNLLLLLMVDITRMADEIINDQEERNRVAHVDTVISHRFLDNQFIQQLASNKQLMHFADTNPALGWGQDRELLKKLYAAITESEYYAEYMTQTDVDYYADRELWRKLYKNIIMRADEIDENIEDKCIYWNDDKEIVDTFVLKTIKRFEPANGADQDLLPEFRDYEDKEFAKAEAQFWKASADPRFTDLTDFYIVDCEFNQGNYEFAIREGERIYEKVPAPRRERLARLISEAYLIRGDNTYAVEKVPDAAVIGVLTGFQRKGKQYDVSDRAYRRYVRIWNAIYPLRAFRVRFRREAVQIARKLGILPPLKKLFGKKGTE